MNPSILLVEDDPTTCAYLQAITTALPARVDTAASIAEALQQAAAHHHALWMIDAHLPDGSGVELLARLRARHGPVPALAHTAARNRSELDPLIEAGFAEVLVKPIDSATWQAAIRRALGGAKPAPPVLSDACAEGKLPLWDDDASARALGGSSANVAALRGLFLEELPVQVAAVRDQAGEPRRQQLHRLRASCALVGARRLEAAAQCLQEQEDAVALSAFLHTATDTLAQAPPH
jgi:CheY-like chemotaxis protein